MTRKVLALSFALLGAGCAAALPVSPDNAFHTPPTLSVRLVASGPQLPGPRQLHTDDTVQPGEQVELQIAAPNPAHVYVVVFAETGSASLLYGGAAHRQVAPNEVVRITVPRRVLPGGVQVPETRLFVLSTEAPLEPALCPLLRVACPLGEAGASTGAPAQPGRGDTCDLTALAPAAAGIHSPATVIPLVLKYR